MAAAAGGLHSAAVVEDGSLFVWGSGFYSQLGTGDTANRLAPTRVAGLPAPVRQVAAGEAHTGILTEAGDLLMCGEGEAGRLGLGDEDDRTTPTLVARAARRRASGPGCWRCRPSRAGRSHLCPTQRGRRPRPPRRCGSPRRQQPSWRALTVRNQREPAGQRRRS